VRIYILFVTLIFISLWFSIETLFLFLLPPLLSIDCWYKQFNSVIIFTSPLMIKYEQRLIKNHTQHALWEVFNSYSKRLDERIALIWQIMSIICKPFLIMSYQAPTHISGEGARAEWVSGLKALSPFENEWRRLWLVATCNECF
jgi:hypothetical protein